MSIGQADPRVSPRPLPEPDRGPRRRSPLAALLAAACLVALLAAPARAATWVSYSSLLGQARTGPVIRAIINPGRRDVEIKFKDLSEWHAFYPPGQQPALQRLFHQRHIRLLFASRRARSAAHVGKPAAVHHHLRYIAAGVAAALALLAGAGLAYRRRRRTQPPAHSPS